MNKVYHYAGFSVQVDPDDLLRLLGYGRERRPDNELATLLREMTEKAEGLAEPAAIFSVFSRKSMPRGSFLSELFDVAQNSDANRRTIGTGHENRGQTQASQLNGEVAHYVVLAICTIGRPLEESVSEYSDSGELARALILDAAGSSLAEAVCDFVNGKICSLAGQRSLHPAPRISPGYGRWSIEEQEIIFRLLPASSIGVSLTPSYMMVPRKSVSFAVKLMEQRPLQEKTSPCTRCGRKNCEFRR